jgi:hypothetical protein
MPESGPYLVGHHARSRVAARSTAALPRTHRSDLPSRQGTSSSRSTGSPHRSARRDRSGPVAIQALGRRRFRQFGAEPRLLARVELPRNASVARSQDAAAPRRGRRSSHSGAAATGVVRMAVTRARSSKRRRASPRALIVGERHVPPRRSGASGCPLAAALRGYGSAPSRRYRRLGCPRAGGSRGGGRCRPPAGALVIRGRPRALPPRARARRACV